MDQDKKRNSSAGSPAENHDGEIDIVDILKRLWIRRRFILIVTCVGIVIGILTALITPKEYTSKCTVVLSGSGRPTGNLSGLAAMVGINLSTGEGEILSPSVYPIIMASTSFQKDMINTPITFSGYREPVTLLDYYTDPKYKKFNLGQTLMKYTIGLPGMLMGAIRGGGDSAPFPLSEGSQIYSLSKEELACVEILKNKIELDINSKDGFISITARMPEPLAAAQVAEEVYQLLQRYVTMFKIEKVQSNLDFVQERYDEARKDFDQVQAERATYLDANRGFSSNTAKIEISKLDASYSLSLSVYTELAVQLEQAKINVKETVPVLTVIDPVTIPVKHSKPKLAQTVIGLTFLAFAVAVLVVMLTPFTKKLVGQLTETNKNNKNNFIR